MAFFNKKEEVLDFQLTEYGKRLLEQGNLKPALYSFFDDDILYDTEAGSFSGSVENQNSADRRIKYETPSLRVQKHTTGAETRVNQFLEEVSGTVSQKSGSTSQFLIAENSVEFINAFQDTPQFAQKFFLGSDPIGTSDLKSSNAPAWQINCLANEISSSQPYLTTNLTSSNTELGQGIVRKIPQLDITIDYKTFYLEEENVQDYDDPVLKNIISLGTSPSSSIGLYVQENYLVLDIAEANTGNLKENFDIEVFERSQGTYIHPNAASASIEIFSTGPQVGQYITLTSTDGTIIEYAAASSEDTSVREFDVSSADPATIATSLKDCIIAPDGHDGKILVTDDLAGTLTLTQETAGELGNRGISDNLYYTNVTPATVAGGASFAGGTTRPHYTYTRKMFIGANGEMVESTDTSQVEHYLNIMVDQEIPSEVLTSLQITDNMIKGSSVRSNLSRNLYTTDNEEPC
jgi:hypothetical protein